MHYSSGNYEAFVRPRKPEGADKKTAWFVGSGLAGLAGAVAADPAEALLGDAQCRVHPGPHVLDPDLIGQLDEAVGAEAPAQVVDLFLGDGVRIGAHAVGVGDGRPLVVGVERGGGIGVDVLEPVEIQALESHEHRAEVDAPGAAHGAGGPVHREFADADRQCLRRALQQAFVHGIGHQQCRVVGVDGHRFGDLAEAAFGPAVHQPDHRGGLGRGQGFESCCRRI